LEFLTNAIFLPPPADPYELYEYVHVAEVGNATGSGQGGMRSLKRLYVGRLMDESVQSDILQENFINVSSARVSFVSFTDPFGLRLLLPGSICFC
jgi:3-oxoacyl-(acyl-carrier-protein) synthase